MCLPLLAALPAGLSTATAVAGTAISAAGAYASASAQSASYKAQSAFARRQETMARQKGAYESSRLREIHDRQLSTMRGQYLSSGIALEGSAVDVLQDSATEASLDEQAIRYGAEVNARNYGFQAELAQSNAKRAMTGGIIGASSRMIGGFSDALYDQQSLAVAASPSPQRQATRINNPYVDRF